MDFENSSSEILAPVLLKFYAEMRNKKGALYKRSVLLAIRNGLASHFSSMDIIKDPAFKNANQMFLSMVKKTSKERKGAIQHKVQITEDDLKKLYSSMMFNIDTPSGTKHIPETFSLNHF